MRFSIFLAAVFTSVSDSAIAPMVSINMLDTLKKISQYRECCHPSIISKLFHAAPAAALAVAQYIFIINILLQTSFVQLILIPFLEIMSK